MSIIPDTVHPFGAILWAVTQIHLPYTALFLGSLGVRPTGSELPFTVAEQDELTPTTVYVLSAHEVPQAD